ncbi:uncharacterized protein VTP21DRAFT_6880 [Calcarisporiella thermophila]|uniref:uncharacterized protein n=1 Tax=Calcarisporiella thermophila TaxID=911321 RepID=UPI00374457E2
MAPSTNHKFLVVCTSFSHNPNGEKYFGNFLPEIAVPYYFLKSRGFAVELCSVQGGKIPLDPLSVEIMSNYPYCQQYLSEKPGDNVRSVDEVLKEDLSNVVGIHFPGGCGPVFDMLHNKPIHDLIRKVYEKNGGLVSAVCHGQAALVHATLSDSTPLILDKRCTAWTNAEDKKLGTYGTLPIQIEDELRKAGGVFIEGPAPLWPHVVCDGRLITAPQPESLVEMVWVIMKVLQEGVLKA